MNSPVTVRWPSVSEGDADVAVDTGRSHTNTASQEVNSILGVNGSMVVLRRRHEQCFAMTTSNISLVIVEMQ